MLGDFRKDQAWSVKSNDPITDDSAADDEKASLPAIGVIVLQPAACINR